MFLSLANRVLGSSRRCLRDPLTMQLETLETRRLLAISIFAEGATGEETMELQIDGQTVQTWTNVDTQLSSYAYQVSGIAVDRIRVAFTNDGETSGGDDRNLRVDRINVDGTDYQTEASNVLSTGTWSPGNGCDPGFKQSEWLHCNGFFQFSEDASTSTIVIDAAGATGEETMALRIDGVVVQEWSNVGGDFDNRQFQAFTYQHNGSVAIGDIQVAFTNDGISSLGEDRNLKVDRVTLDGTVFETEAPSVYSTGTWSTADGCAPGNKQSEILHCGGYFQYAGTTIAIHAAGETGEETMELRIDGVAVASWNNVGGDPGARVFETFIYQASETVTVDQISVAFTNDFYDPPVDRNLHVDFIEVNQIIYQSESPSVFSTGTWTSTDGCTPGYKNSEVLGCGGYLQFAAGEGANPGVIALSTNSVTVDEADDFAVVSVNRTGGSDGLVTVDYRTVDDSATSPADYSSVSGRFLFADGETSKSIQIPIVQDNDAEGLESFSFTIDNVNGGATLLAPRTAIVTILDDEVPSGLGGFDVTYSGFAEALNLSLNGDAAINGSVLTLTPDAANESGSAFYNSAIEFAADTSFRTHFTFRLVGGQGAGGADGFTFTLQNTAAVSTALGGGGEAQGYGGIGSSSVAIEFDTYGNAYDPSDNHVSVLVGGDVTSALSSVGVPFDLNGGDVGHAWIEYDGDMNLLSVYVADSPTRPSTPLLIQNVDLAPVLGDRAFFGFTAATGGLSNAHRILNWDFESSTFLAPNQVDFAQQPIVTGLVQPIAIDWSPDGQNMYIAEKAGVVKVFRNGVLQSAPFIDISAQVNGVRDRGLLDIAIHPDLVNNPYVYLLFTYDPPEVYQNTGLAGPDGMGNRAGRLIRVTADASTNYTTAVPNSEVILLGTNSTWNNYNGAVNSTTDFDEPPAGILPGGANLQDFLAADSESHTVGAVEFGPDGALYVSNGDGTSYNQVDPRTVRVQDIDNLSGKILRIDPITGAGLVDNPFYNGDPNRNQSKVYQYGLRNPFRFTIDQSNGRVFVGDVGWTKWEEVNSGAAGANFGWPYYEGASGINEQTSGYSELPEAQAFYDSGEVPTPSILALNHAVDSINAIVMGDVITGSVYPSQYVGNLIFNDLGQGIVRNVSFDTNGFATAVDTFATGAQIVVAMKSAPDGYMYYVDLDDGVVGRWEVAQAAASAGASSFATSGSDGFTEASVPDWIKFTSTRARIDASQIDGALIINLADRVIASDSELIEIPDHVERVMATGDREQTRTIHVVTPNADTTTQLRPGRLALTGGGHQLTASRFGAFTVIAQGDADHVTLRGSRGADQLNFTPGHVTMIGADYEYTVIGFASVDSVARRGGLDEAVFHDSEGDDIFSAAAREATFSGSGFAITATDFARSRAISTGGDDVAALTGSRSDDLASISDVGTLIQSGNYIHHVQGFAHVELISSGRGNDVVEIAGSLAAERLEGYRGYGTLWFDEQRYVSFDSFDAVRMTNFDVHRDALEVSEQEYELLVTE